jgi:cellulose synthase/poly-beta-1,6-N-acetylglucosamine synthase-like glycosyltransferase
MLVGDRVLVVADNCTDETASVAQQCGALVVERFDPVLRGKSYALQHGWHLLESDPPDVIVFMDADCTADPGSISQIAELAAATGRPVQAAYILDAPHGGDPQRELSALAAMIKNLVRPAGLDRLGLACFLNGSGMALPRAALQDIDLASGKLAEDKWLTVDLALRGHLPLFCHEARIRSRIPANARGARTQSTRWLYGHLECMLLRGPLLLISALRQKRFDVFAVALDLCIPPISLLLALWATLLAGAIAEGVSHSWWIPAELLLAGAAAMSVSLAGALWKFGGGPCLAYILRVPAYVLSRLPLYIAFLIRRPKEWVPTTRDEPPNHKGEETEIDRDLNSPATRSNRD